MKFSVVIPIYNSENTICRCIESVLNQSVKDFEIVVVDDGSTDNSYTILQDYEQKGKIRLFRQNNSGPGAARNQAIKNSYGEYIAFLDSDDYWESDYLQTVLLAGANQGIDIIYLDVYKERENGKIIYCSNNKRFKNVSKEKLISFQITGKLPWGMIKVAKRTLICSVNTQFTNIQVGEEAIFSFDLLLNAESFSFTGKPIYHYVQYSTGQHKKGDLDPWGPLTEKMKEHLLEKDCLTLG